MSGDGRLGLGVGLDLPWKAPYGIVGTRVADRTIRFLQRYAERFAYLFVSWQPPDRGVPRLEDVREPFDDLFARVPIAARALHQTALNLAGVRYDRRAIVALTNDLVARYGFAWVNEDLGSWSVRGRPLPYPQPPPLTDDGVQWCTRTCAEVGAELAVPLVVEFPGFESPVPWLHGELDAYDAFCRIVEGADVRCNLDTGHLLTWRHLAGHRGDALLADLDRLPLDRCVEIHCAGTVFSEGRMIDAHHGVLLDLQLELLDELMRRCPALKVVTWEDPRFGDDGELAPALLASVDALAARVDAWMRTPTVDAPASRAEPLELRSFATEPFAWEDELERELVAPTDFGRRCRAQVLARSGRGVGRLVDLYPVAIAAWCAGRDESDVLDALVIAFLESAAGRAWSEYAWAVPGLCIEDAFGRFLAPGQHEHLLACAKVLAIHRAPAFEIPDAFSCAAKGWYAIGGDVEPVLYAAVDGKLLHGVITPLVRDLLRGARPQGSEPAREKLVAMGLLERDPLE